MKIATILLSIFLSINSFAQNASMSKIEIGYSVTGIMLPKPNVLIDYGDIVIRPTNHFGLEHGIAIRYIINDNLKLNGSFHKGSAEVFFFLDYQFTEDWAKSLNIDYTHDDIMKVRRAYRGGVAYVFYKYSNLELNLEYSMFEHKKLSASIYAGLNLLSFRSSIGDGNSVSFEYDNEDYFELPIYYEYSMNANKMEYQKFDFGLSYGFTLNQRIKNYHNLSLSLGMTWVPRYLLSAEYKVYTPSGMHQGNIIQSSTMFNLRIAYYLNWGAISHYGKTN
jgi:hypothetical protein